MHYLKTDFDKVSKSCNRSQSVTGCGLRANCNQWVDEDEQDGAPEDDAMAGMGGMPGMGGMGGMGEDGGFGGIGELSRFLSPTIDNL